jgi:hypothetical protein
VTRSGAVLLGRLDLARVLTEFGRDVRQVERFEHGRFGRKGPEILPGPPRDPVLVDPEPLEQGAVAELDIERLRPREIEEHGAERVGRRKSDIDPFPPVPDRGPPAARLDHLVRDQAEAGSVCRSSPMIDVADRRLSPA